MSKRDKRIKIINFLYRHFVLKNDILTTKKEIFDYYKINIKYIEIKKINEILINLSNIILNISKYLKKGWDFSRLSNYHKAVLVSGFYEIYYQKLKKAIVINESLEILKLYSEDTDFSYINSILDKI